MIIEITLTDVLIVAGLSLSLLITAVCAFFVAKKCRKRKDIRGKVALVTGGGNGLGKQICIRLANYGCKVAVADLDFVAAQHTAEDLMKMGVAAKAYKIDVSKYSEIVQLRDDIKKDLGPVEILINNAGLIPIKTIFQQSPEELERLTKVNFLAVMFMTKVFLEGMIRRKSGHVATVSSLQGIYPNSYCLAYCATKYAATGFMLGLKEFIRRRKLHKQIFITLIMPDVMETRQDILDTVHSSYDKLKPEDVAEQTVDGILFNDSIVAAPCYMSLAIKIFHLFPFSMQHFLRDHMGKDVHFLADDINLNEIV